MWTLREREEAHSRRGERNRGMTHQRLVARVRRGPGGIRDGIEPEAVRVWLLGGFEVSVRSRVVEDDAWRLRKARSLVKLLALAPGHRLHRERIMDVLWPDLDAKSQANNLHRTLYLARKVLEGSPANAAPSCLRLREDLVALCPVSKRQCSTPSQIVRSSSGGGTYTKTTAHPQRAGYQHTTGGRAHPTGAGGSGPRRTGADEPPDRRGTLHLRAYGRDPPPQDPQEAGAALPGPTLSLEATEVLV
jgi:hypothetical protein